MARDETHVVSQGQQFFVNRLQQGGMIAPREIGAADGTPEQNVSHQRQTFPPMEIDHVARRMPRAVQHLEPLLTEPYLVSLLEPAIRVQGFRRWKTVDLTLPGKGFQEKAILLLGTLHRNGEPLGEFPCATYVIEVAMGQQDSLYFHLLLLHHCDDALDLPAGIHDRGATGRFAPQQAAVLLEWRDRSDEIVHCVPSLEG